MKKDSKKNTEAAGRPRQNKGDLSGSGKNCVPLNLTLPMAQRDSTDNKTNSAIPSDEAVNAMRNWCEEKTQ